MDLIKLSRISYFDEYKMYMINLGFYSRFYDYFVYGYENTYKIYGSNITGFKFESGKISNNKIIGVIDYFGLILVHIWDLNNFESKYIFSKSCIVKSIFLNSNEVNIFIYENIKGDIDYFVDGDCQGFDFFIEDKQLIVKNSVFDTVIDFFDIDFDISIKAIQYESKEIFYDIIDFYYFNDLFINDNDELSLLFNYFNEKVFKNSFGLFKISSTNFVDINGPKSMIKIFTNNKDNQTINQIIKVFLFVNPNSFLVDSVSNDNIILNLKEFVLINNLNIEQLNINFQLPKDYFYYDIDFKNFQIDFMKLRYGLFSLYRYYDEINGIKQQNNPYIMLSLQRLKLTKNALSKIILEYKNKLKIIIELINFKKNG